MPQGSARALVLQAAVVNEQDKLVHLLARDRGIVRAIAPGGAKSRNRFGALLEPFTDGEFFFYWGEEKETVTLSKGEIKASFFDLASRPDNIFYFSLMAEIILKFIPHHHYDPRHYKLLLSLLTGRERGIGNPLLLLYLLVWLLRIEGLLFNPDACSNCHERGLRRAWLRLDYRGILCRRCRREETAVLEEEELQYIRWTRSHSPASLAAWEGRLRAGRFIRTLIRKIEYHGEFSLASSQFIPEFR